MNLKFNESALEELNKIAIQFLNDVANNVKEESKVLAPVDTGALRDSIDVYEGNNDKEKLIGSKIHYAIYQELGTSKISPQPYLRPALDQVIGDLNDNNTSN
jgi:HK97 gp10 family phage protein